MSTKLLRFVFVTVIALWVLALAIWTYVELEDSNFTDLTRFCIATFVAAPLATAVYYGLEYYSTDVEAKANSNEAAPQ